MIENSQGPRAKPKQIAWFVWRRKEYQCICPTQPIMAICVQTFIEKTDMIMSWKIFPANLIKRIVVVIRFSGCNRG